jgi:Uma2 family endonuclease
VVIKVREKEKISFEEFLSLDKKNDELMEFIDGEVYLQASPNTVHQRISRKLSTIFDLYFSGKECEPFTAPFDIILTSERKRAKNKVIPDISVICNKSGLNDKNYVGIPDLIVEILSPSTAWVDISKKLELYQSFGVKEYWIISPKNSNVQVFNLNDEGFYDEPVIYYKEDIVTSSLFKDLSDRLKEIFE